MLTITKRIVNLEYRIFVEVQSRAQNNRHDLEVLYSLMKIYGMYWPLMTAQYMYNNHAHVYLIVQYMYNNHTHVYLIAHNEFK